MAATIIDGKAISREMREQIRQEVSDLRSRGIVPGLAVILVGNNPASRIYITNKEKACHDVGIYSEEYQLPEDTSEEALLSLIERLNHDDRIHGILVQLPLPSRITAQTVLEAVAPDKDVDGFHPYNIGRLTRGDPIFSPCTPHGVMVMLERGGVLCEGKNAVVLGRSNIVGKPMALMLMHRHATVTICHSRTKDLEAICRRADILVSAIGKPCTVRADMVKEGAVVVDVGINRLADGRLVGDVDYEAVSQKAGWITPVPGGVGPMTITMLLSNTLEAAKRASVEKELKS